MNWTKSPEDLEAFEPIERTKLREEDYGPKRKTNKKSIRKARERKAYIPTLDNEGTMKTNQPVTEEMVAAAKRWAEEFTFMPQTDSAWRELLEAAQTKSSPAAPKEQEASVQDVGAVLSGCVLDQGGKVDVRATAKAIAAHFRLTFREKQASFPAAPP